MRKRSLVLALLLVGVGGCAPTDGSAVPSYIRFVQGFALGAVFSQFVLRRRK